MLPALVGVVIGGFVAGAIGAVAGFVLYDVFFLPPYNTLTVHSPQNWIALVVYVVVVLVVAQVVAQLRAAREDALRRTDESVRLFELSQTLIGDLSLSQLALAHRGRRPGDLLPDVDRTGAAGRGRGAARGGRVGRRRP